MNFTNEQLTKAKQAKSADELLTLAKESGIEMTADEAAKYFAELHKEGELNDNELGAVAGGKGEEPKEYTVQANWAPSCNGQHVSNGRIIRGCPLVDVCGNCCHFDFNGNLVSSTIGVCRREFK